MRLHALCDRLLKQYIRALCWHHLHQYALSSPPTSDSILIIVSVKGVEELAINFYDERITNGFMSVMIGVLFTLTVYFIETIRSTALFTESVRELLADYAYPVSPRPCKRGSWANIS